MRFRFHHATILDLRLEGGGSGTEIHYNARLPVIALVFLVVWFGFAIAIGVPLFIGALFDAVEGDRNAVVLVVPGMIAGTAAMVWLDRFMARHDKKYLLDFVRYMLDAETSAT